MNQAKNLQGVVPYAALLGGVIQQQRKFLGQQQGDFAQQLGQSQSTYSRIESGDIALSVTQLRQIAQLFGVSAQSILDQADSVAAHLFNQGVQITHEKKDNSAAILIGLGFLAVALLAATSQ